MIQKEATPNDHPCQNKDSDLFRVCNMKRKAKGYPTTADYTVWTLELSRRELMIIINGIRNHLINRAKLHLRHIRARNHK